MCGDQENLHSAKEERTGEEHKDNTEVDDKGSYQNRNKKRSRKIV